MYSESHNYRFGIWLHFLSAARYMKKGMWVNLYSGFMLQPLYMDDIIII